MKKNHTCLLGHKLTITTLIAAVSGAGSGCAPDLPVSCDCGEDPTTTCGAVQVRSEPEAPHDALPPVLRLHVYPEPGQELPADLQPEDLFLIRGEVGPVQLGQLERNQISMVLADRIVPALRWQAEDGHVVIAPTAVLAPAEGYTLASGRLDLALPLTVAPEDPLPLLERVWPPAGGSASATAGIWCGPAPLPEGLAMPLTLDPGGPDGLLRSGADGTGSGRHCVHLEAPPAAGELPSELLVGPPLFEAAGVPAGRLDPRALSADRPWEPVEPRACEAGQQPFGPGCAAVLDDRLVAYSPGATLLWSIAGAPGSAAAGLDQVLSSQPDEPFVLTGLPPDSPIGLLVTTIDSAGSAYSSGFSAHTLPAMAHVVLNEVLANSLGPEPSQEWVELYNDGAAPAQLGGYRLTDIGGETLLPEAILAPGQHALLVNESYDESLDYDVQPPAGALLLRVPKLGKNGLSNQGEPLKLYDGEGIVVSRFPAEPKPQAGISVMRVHPKAPDGAAGSFVLSPSQATPGLPNG